MKKSMFEYTKIILQKVSFDRKLFFKEYRKAQTLLQPQEVRELRLWLRNNQFPWQPNH
jgi:hypothetical protein